MKGFTTNDHDAVERLIIGSRPSKDLRDDALEDLRRQLADERAWGKRGWDRVKLLEDKIEQMRDIIR